MRHIAVGLIWVLAATANAAEVRSPNGEVRFTLTADGGQLQYAVEFGSKVVIRKSPVVFSVDGMAVAREVKLDKAETYEINEKYPWRGVHSTAVNHCKGVKIPVSDLDYLEVRVFNDGVAFRQIVPATGGRPRVPDESTAFTLPEGSTVWYHDLGGHYEAVHQKKEVGAVEAGQWAAPPVTFQLPGNGGFASITEAALINYPGMALQADGKGTFNLVLGHKHPISYPYRLRYSNDIERVSQPAKVNGGIVTPWRVIVIGKDLNALVNSDIVHNLCPAPDPKLFPKGMATDWIKPGRAVWKYLDGGANTFEDMKNFCQWAGELGFEHHVIEGFWRRWSDEQLKELVSFGKERGVGIWLWRHSRELRESESRRAFFAKCRDAGVVGVKLDFFDHEAKEIVDFYETLLRETAEHKLMVNFHGANKPTGEARTWPNELIREGVRGMESSRLKERARHNTTLPFTRYLAGHGDYTPVHFGARRGDTTWAHQIATAVVFTEPLLTYGAHPTNLLKNPGLEMIKSIPAVWDETVVLPGSAIGELAAFARRKGNEWFVAVLNGPEARTVKLPLPFLGAGQYKAHVVRDDPGEAAAVQIENAQLGAKDTLNLELASGGGYVARLSTAKTAAKKKVLVLTGGHGFKREPFFRMFADNPDIAFSEAKHSQAAEGYESDDLLKQDAVVLYDMPKTITDAQKAKFMSLFERGIGLVVLHHALCAYQQWPEYERIIGGRYAEPGNKPGVVTEAVGYEHDVDVPVKILARDHPVTAGLKDFTIHDEIYWGFRVGADVTPLLTTTHPKSGKPLGWARTEGKSRVVFIQLGHGPEAFGDSNYRRLVAQSIAWVAKP